MTKIRKQPPQTSRQLSHRLAWILKRKTLTKLKFQSLLPSTVRMDLTSSK